jgi:hypothetical protein
MRFQAKIATIHSSIASKVQIGEWKPGIGRTRQGHWFAALIRNTKAYLTDTWNQGVLAAFDELVQRGLVPVARSI